MVPPNNFKTDSTDGTPPKSRAVILITDLQEGAKLDGLQGHEWPKGVRVVIERVDAKPQSNAGLEILDQAANSAGAENDMRVRVANARDSSREKFQLSGVGTVTSVAGAPMEIYLPPGQSRTFSAPKLPAGTTTGKLQLSGDEVDFDNRFVFRRAGS